MIEFFLYVILCTNGYIPNADRITYVDKIEVNSYYDRGLPVYTQYIYWDRVKVARGKYEWHVRAWNLDKKFWKKEPLPEHLQGEIFEKQKESFSDHKKAWMEMYRKLCLHEPRKYSWNQRESKYKKPDPTDDLGIKHYPVEIADGLYEYTYHRDKKLPLIIRAPMVVYTINNSIWAEKDVVNVPDFEGVRNDPERVNRDILPENQRIPLNGQKTHEIF